MKIKDTIGLIKYNYSYKGQLYVMIMGFVFAVLFLYFIPSGAYIGFMEMSVFSAVIPLNITALLFSSFISSSEIIHKALLKNATIIYFIINIIDFILFVVLKSIQHFRTFRENELPFILLLYCFYTLFGTLYTAIAHKKKFWGYTVLGIMALVTFLMIPVMAHRYVILLSSDVSTNIIDKSLYIHVPIIPNITILYIVTLLVCLLSPILYYVISKKLAIIPFTYNAVSTQEKNRL